MCACFLFFICCFIFIVVVGGVVWVRKWGLSGRSWKGKCDQIIYYEKIFLN